jgi:DNA-directed RNA polymerase specialized sigma24 family protein
MMHGEEETLFEESVDVDSERWGLDFVEARQARLKQQERSKFDADFKELLDLKSSTGRLMFAFVRRELKAFHLDKLYREAYVLNEAYVRAIATISKGIIIRDSSAWLRGTMFRIVRELSREHQKTVSLEENLLENRSIVSPEELQNELARLIWAFQFLPPKDQELLHMKVVENLSWQEIREAWRMKGHGDYLEATLRKRKERALIRLRKKYHALSLSD